MLIRKFAEKITALQRNTFRHLAASTVRILSSAGWMALCLRQLVRRVILEVVKAVSFVVSWSRGFRATPQRSGYDSGEP